MNPPRPDTGRATTVGTLGEAGLLAQVLPVLSDPDAEGVLLGPGDDAAVLAAPDGRVVATTDVLVQDRDFTFEWSTGEDVGWKAAMQNLADLAAMGARPTGLLVALALPGSTRVSWAVAVARGLRAACDLAGTTVVGGDLSSAEEVMIAVTALGDLQGRPPLRRDGARPGDVVALAGRTGPSAAGLAILTDLDDRADDDPTLAPWLTAHRRPEPPLAAGPAAAIADATSCLDISDGLLRDAGRIADASGVRIDLDAHALGVDDSAMLALAQRLAENDLQSSGPGAAVRSWVLGGGEDHALLATFPPGVTLPAPFVAVGRVHAHQVGHAGQPAVTVDGEVEIGPRGWDHFGGA